MAIWHFLPFPQRPSFKEKEGKSVYKVSCCGCRKSELIPHALHSELCTIETPITEATLSPRGGYKPN